MQDPNVPIGITFDSVNGITSQTFPEIYTEMTGQSQVIDSNLSMSPNEPIVSINTTLSSAFALGQSAAMSIYSNLNYLNAEGDSLDDCAVRYGVKRGGQRKTLQYISVVVNKALTLNGMDSTGTIFTIQSSVGDNFYLQETQTITSAGTYSFLFESQNYGTLTIGLNSITKIVTPVDGVVSVTNNQAEYQIGRDVETDTDLRNRITLQQSVVSERDIYAIRVALLDTNSVSYALVLENDTDATIQTLPSRYIYILLNAGVIGSEIAETVSTAKTAGVPTFSETGTYAVDSIGNKIYYDVVENVEIYVKLTIKPLDTWAKQDALKAYLVKNVSFDASKSAFQSDITQKGEDFLGTSAAIMTCQVSLDNLTYASEVINPSLRRKYVLAIDKIEITIV